MNIAKIHVWKVPVLLYGDLADRVLIYIHGQGGRKEEAESFAEIATNYGWQVMLCGSGNRPYWKKAEV